jgi:hypothetical protein
MYGNKNIERYERGENPALNNICSSGVLYPAMLDSYIAGTRLDKLF